MRKSPFLLFLQQRVAIARALAKKTGEMIISLIKSLAGEMTVVMITHNSELAGMSDRIIQLQDGKIKE